MCKQSRITHPRGARLGRAPSGADGAQHGAETAWEPLVGPRQRLVATAALSPFFNVRDAYGLAAETRPAVALGFVAKAAVHPAQVAPINAAFTPTADAAAHARTVLRENAKGVETVDGRMIDKAVAHRARRTLAAAGA